MNDEAVMCKLQDLMAKMWLGQLKNTQNTIFKLMIDKHEIFVLVFIGITLVFLAESCQGDQSMVVVGGGGQTQDLVK
jgi:hypothetical protein